MRNRSPVAACSPNDASASSPCVVICSAAVAARNGVARRVDRVASSRDRAAARTAATRRRRRTLLPSHSGTYAPWLPTHRRQPAVGPTAGIPRAARVATARRLRLSLRGLERRRRKSHAGGYRRAGGPPRCSSNPVRARAPSRIGAARSAKRGVARRRQDERSCSAALIASTGGLVQGRFRRGGVSVRDRGNAGRWRSGRASRIDPTSIAPREWACAESICLDANASASPWLLLPPDVRCAFDPRGAWTPAGESSATYARRGAARDAFVVERGARQATIAVSQSERRGRRARHAPSAGRRCPDGVAPADDHTSCGRTRGGSSPLAALASRAGSRLAGSSPRAPIFRTARR